jgi:curved DNA-binding protein CbpA
MTSIYFGHCKSSDEIKREYHRLAKLHHPDIGGDTATMQQINTDYAIAMDAAIRREKSGWTEEAFEDAADVSEAIRQAIEAIIKFDNITVEICGTWVWVSGQTKPIKDTLKQAGYRWAPKKADQPWYFAGTPSRNRRRNYSLDEIRERYGSEVVKDGKEQKPFRPLFA